MAVSKTSFVFIVHPTPLMNVQIILLRYHLDAKLAGTGATTPTSRWYWVHISPHNKLEKLEAGDWPSVGMLG